MADHVIVTDSKGVVLCRREALYYSEALCRGDAVAFPRRLAPLEMAAFLLFFIRAVQLT